jgi:hypothetical protein
MSPPELAPVFKDEAVRQITKRGYSVAEVSARLGVVMLIVFLSLSWILMRKVEKIAEQN